MNKRLIIIGAGGHGKVAADCASLLGRYNTIVFFDALYPQLQSTGHWSVIATGDEIDSYIDINSEFFVAIGDNNTRRKVTQQLLHKQAAIATLIHPSAQVSRYSTIGEGSLICANAVVNIETRVGLASIINTAATVDHDCVLENFVHVAPGARLAGGVSVGECSFIGIGSVIIQGKIVGKSCILGAGSTLLVDLADCSVAVGSPAKVIKQI